MTRLHIFGLCFIVTALLLCGATPACHEHFNDLKEVSLVIAAGIIGDANSVKTRTAQPRRVTGQVRTLEGERNDEQ